MKEFRIIKGLPGAGKSFLANQMQDKEGALVFSNDDLLMIDGVYKWDEDRSLMAHWANQRLVSKSMQEGFSPLVLDNINIVPFHVTPYIRLANHYGYKHTVIEIDTPWAMDVDELEKRNQHNVPKKIIEEMKKTLIGLPLEAFVGILDCEIAMDPETSLNFAQEYLEKDDFMQVDQHLFDYEDWCRIGGYQPEGGDDVLHNIQEKMQEWYLSWLE